jgi:carbonic anhydrase
MGHRFLLLLVALAGASQPRTRVVAPAPSDPHWGYEGEAGPDAWGSLSPAFSACGEGRAQSPIDIDAPAKATLPGLKMSFRPASLRIVHHEHVADAIHNGHTIQVNYSAGDELALGEETYELLQYHFHAPSEHTVEGRRFPMEMHLVHRSGRGGFAVIGVLVKEGAHNSAFDPIWSNLPEKKGVETHFESVTVDVDALLPETRTTYRYDGSLTTPPCSEGVKWLVMTSPVALSREQIGAFRKLVGENARPLQPRNGRAVVTDRIADK